MTDTTPLDIDAIAARAEAATPGPWTMWNPSEGPSHLTMENKVVWESKRSASEYGDDEKIPHWCDANFIAHARTDIPALLAEVKRQAGLLDRIREVVELNRQDRMIRIRAILNDESEAGK